MGRKDFLWKQRKAWVRVWKILAKWWYPKVKYKTQGITLNQHPGKKKSSPKLIQEAQVHKTIQKYKNTKKK